jgi:hypothetical protein
MGQSQPPPRGTPPPPPESSIRKPEPLVPHVAGETDLAYESRVRQEVARQAQVFDFREHTRGAKLRIAGKDVQLPPDAYVDAYVVRVMCIAGQKCPETPLYTIKRGNSYISVTLRTGAITHEQVARGEEGTFMFLREALR